MFSTSKKVTRYERHENQSLVKIRYIFAIRIVFTFKIVSPPEGACPPMRTMLLMRLHSIKGQEGEETFDLAMLNIEMF